MQKILITLNDQGGRMDWNHKELAATLRAEMSGHPPVVVLEDENEADSNDGEKIF